MKRWEWVRLRDAYREQRDRAAERGQTGLVMEYDALYKWAEGQVKAANERMYEALRTMAETA